MKTKHSWLLAGLLVAVMAEQVQAGDKEPQSDQQPTNTAVVPAERTEFGVKKRHEEIIKLVRSEKEDLIFVGDSITHFYGGMPKASRATGQETWDRYYGNRRAVNMGFGWDMTQDVLWRLANGELEGAKPKVAVVLIGTNNLTGRRKHRKNTPAEIAEGVEAVCKLIHKEVPKCKILLLGILPRWGFTKAIPEINQLLAELDSENYITFLNIYSEFIDDNGYPRKDLMLPDRTHPNAAGYRVWAETMEPVLSKLLGDKAVSPTKTNGGE